jgi:AcrR family transcriptional regulator
VAIGRDPLRRISGHMEPDRPLAPTATQLLLTAERLFAAHGIDGVALRQIATAAGSSNNSAIAYHFGSKDGLLRAIFSYRINDLLRRRDLLRARSDPDDLRAAVEAHLLPLLEIAEDPESSYIAFIEQLQRTGEAAVILDSPDAVRSRQQFSDDMHRLLVHLDEPARSLRIDQAQACCLHVAAERERSIKLGHERAPFGLFVSTTVDGIAGLLSAPASPETERLMHRSGAPRSVPARAQADRGAAS